jgi:hypothetical protein
MLRINNRESFLIKKELSLYENVEGTDVAMTKGSYFAHSIFGKFPGKGSFPRALFASIVPSVMRENADRSVFPSVIELPPNCFSCVVRDGAHLHVLSANLHDHGRENGCGNENDPGPITYRKTDPSAFSRIRDGTTDAKRACGNYP